MFARNLFWNWTRAGDVAIQPCPHESTGLARWACDLENLQFDGQQPDMSDCKSVEVTDLETRVREEDPENVIVSALERLTEKGAAKLYGGDLEAVVNVLKAVLNRLQYMLQTKAASIYNKESFLQEIFQNVLRTGSNLMANQTLPAWRDLSRSRRIKVASSLVETLEEHAFLLVSVLEHPEVIQESTNEIGKIKYSQFSPDKNGPFFLCSCCSICYRHFIIEFPCGKLDSISLFGRRRESKHCQ